MFRKSFILILKLQQKITSSCKWIIGEVAGIEPAIAFNPLLRLALAALRRGTTKPRLSILD
jgi:hypothetical protein